MEFSFKLPEDDGNQRGAYRARVPGLHLRIQDDGQTCEVKDISASGVAFENKSGNYKVHQALKTDLVIKGKVYLAALPCEVTRLLENGVVAARFKGLDRRQESKLDKLVLEVQKRMIASRKAKKTDPQE